MEAFDGLGASYMGLVAALLAGALFGLLAERTHFCTMGAVADVALFGSWRRVRLWALAVAAAATVASAFAWSGLLDPTSSLAWQAGHAPAAFCGGLLFGAGMVVAGGCVSRAWIRACSGSARAVAVIVVAFVAAWATQLALAAAGVAAERSAIASPGAALDGGHLALAMSAFAVALGGWALADPKLRVWHGPAAATAALGALAAFGYGLSVGPAVDGFRFLPPPGAAEMGVVTIGVAFLVGCTLGAHGGARAGRRWRFEALGTGPDLGRTLAGAAAMGIGGTLALGDTVGAGITGAAVLAPTAWLTMLGMALGGSLAVKILLAGGIGAWWRTLRRRAST